MVSRLLINPSNTAQPSSTPSARLDAENPEPGDTPEVIRDRLFGLVANRVGRAGAWCTARLRSG
jgi:hypothetical protein